MPTTELGIINRGPLNYEFSTVYDGERYYTEFNYNDRNDTWYMNFKDADRQTLLAGVACLSNVEQMIRRFALDNVFPFGDILVADSSNNGADPDRENFGDVVSAFYTTVVTT